MDLDNGMTVPAVAPLAGALPKAAPKLSANQKKCLDVLKAELRRFGRYDIEKEFDEMPPGTKFIDERQWKDACAGPKHAIAESTFRLARDGLDARGVVGRLYSKVWVV